MTIKQLIQHLEATARMFGENQEIRIQMNHNGEIHKIIGFTERFPPQKDEFSGGTNQQTIIITTKDDE